MRVSLRRIPLWRIPLRRISRRQASSALLVAAFVLLSVAASLRYFGSSPRPAAAGTTTLTPAAGSGSPAGQNAGGTGPTSSAGSAAGHPGQVATGPTRAITHGVLPPAVNVSGAAALPSAHVHAALASPEDAVDGFYLALLGGTPARACAYVMSPCPSFGSRPITGQVTVLDAVSDGGQALVEITGSICVGTSCVPLVDRVMMPAGPAAFSESWTSLTSGVYGWAASPLPCVQDPATGQWRVKLE